MSNIHEMMDEMYGFGTRKSAGIDSYTPIFCPICREHTMTFEANNRARCSKCLFLTRQFLSYEDAREQMEMLRVLP